MSKSLFAALMTVCTLAGCNHVPAAAPIVETKVYRAVKPKILPALPAAEKPAQNPNYVPHVAVFPAEQVAASFVETKGDEAYVEVSEIPQTAVQATTVKDAAQQVVDAKFNAVPVWELKSEGEAIVSKAKLTLSDSTGTYTAAFMMTAEELGLEEGFKGTKAVKLDLARPEVLRFLESWPDAKRLQLSATLVAPNGAALTNRGGKPLELVLPFEVR